mmetsp:Transcript_26156/g.25770  ORF Transcript_26156/g.25770 Transcript_26156/m.25770 type:complete len:151 (+) Transcript_26156:74-526(+)
MHRFADNTYNTNYLSTVGVDFKVSKICQNDLKIKLQIWDTAGQERFRDIALSYYSGANGFIIVFDVTNAESFRSLSKRINDIDNYASARKSVIIVGNKADLEAARKVSFDEAKNFAEGNGMGYIEVSAATGHNIHQAFELLTREMISKLT